MRDLAHLNSVASNIRPSGIKRNAGPGKKIRRVPNKRQPNPKSTTSILASSGCLELLMNSRICFLYFSSFLLYLYSDIRLLAHWAHSFVRTALHKRMCYIRIG
jgi:hypothetical protein